MVSFAREHVLSQSLSTTFRVFSNCRRQDHQGDRPVNRKNQNPSTKDQRIVESATKPLKVLKDSFDDFCCVRSRVAIQPDLVYQVFSLGQPVSLDETGPNKPADQSLRKTIPNKSGLRSAKHSLFWIEILLDPWPWLFPGITHSNLWLLLTCRHHFSLPVTIRCENLSLLSSRDAWSWARY